MQSFRRKLLLYATSIQVKCTVAVALALIITEASEADITTGGPCPPDARRPSVAESVVDFWIHKTRDLQNGQGFSTESRRELSDSQKT